MKNILRGKKHKLSEILMLAVLALTGCDSGETSAKMYQLDDITASFSWIGKATYEIGGSVEDYVTDDRIPIKGKLFEVNVDGSALLTEDVSTHDLVINEINLYAVDVPFYQMSNMLSEHYGLPYGISEGEYSAVDGGAVTWEYFDTEKGTIKLSKASERDYCLIEYSLLKPDIAQEEKTQIVYEVDEIAELTKWIGKTPNELGIPWGCLEGRSVNFVGDLFGTRTMGKAWLFEDFADSPVEAIDVYEVPLSDEYDHDEAFEKEIQKFTDFFGEPVDEGLEPYAIANGGEVAWYLFFDGDTYIKASCGSENDYYRMEIMLQ